MTASDFRRMALAFEAVAEGSHMGHADFRVGGRKIFCTLNAEETRGMVSLTPDQQKSFMAEHPGMFVPASGAWGLQGSTMVELSGADPEAVGEALTCAWQRVSAAMATSAKRGTKSGARNEKKRATKRRGSSNTPAGKKRGATKRRR